LSLVRQLRLLFLGIGATLGTFYPFLVVILQERGLDAAAIGAVTAASSVAFAVAVPVWGHLGDVTIGRVRALQVGAAASAVVVVLFGLPLPALVAAGLVVAFSLFESSFSPLSDALALANVVDRDRDYPRIRLMSSIGFAAASVVCGVLYERAGYGAASILFAVGAAVIVMSVVRVPDAPRARLHRETSREGSRVPRLGSVGAAFALQPRLPLVLVAIGLVHIGILSGFTFLPLRLVALGGGPEIIALSAGVAALAEVPAMFYSGAIAKRIGLRGLFAGACVLYAAMLASWIVIDSPLVLVATRVVTGFGFAGVAVGSALTLGTLLPVQLQATGQALLQTVAFGIAAVIANLGGGIVYANAGAAPVFAIGAVAAAAAAVLGWLVFPRRGPAVGEGGEGAMIAPELEVPFAV
jgi:PPP family 3-phenylpropionic acid transporter